MTSPGLFHWQDQYLKGVPKVDTFVLNINGAVTSIVPVPQQSAILSTVAALTQTQIDAFFGSVNEILADKYDTTSMGADAQGILLNYNGQVQQLCAVRASCYSSTGGSTGVTRVCQDTGLTATTLQTAATKTALGNIGIKLDWGNTPDFDGLTAGTIVLEVIWVSK